MADTAPMDPIGSEDDKDTETLPKMVAPNYHRPDLPEMADILGSDVEKQGDREIAIMSFVRAQSAFIRAQIYFMEVGRAQSDDVMYIQHLTGFATAQSAFIKAQQDFVQRFGAI